MSLLSDLKEDAKRYDSPSLLVAAVHPGFRVGLLWRLAIQQVRKGNRFRAAWLRQRILVRYGCDLSPWAVVGPGVKLPHPVGIVVGRLVHIGCGVTLMQNSTLGGNFGRRDDAGREVPSLGDFVFVGPGSAVLGPVRVERDMLVGANQVVVRDVS